MPNRTRLNVALTSFWGKWFLLAFLTGCLARLAAILFDFCIWSVHHAVTGIWSGFRVVEFPMEPLPEGESSAEINIWFLLPIVACGGLISGLLVYWLAPEAEGAGIDGVVDSFHSRRGNVPLRVVIVKLIASAVTLGTGGSAGREGPIAQIGGGIGSCLGKYLKLSNHDRRLLLAIGLGAGVGAVFRAPLAGAIFAAEILYRGADLETDVIIPGAVASTVSYSVFQLTLPPSAQFKPLFGNALRYDVGQLVEMIPFTVLAFAVVVVAWVYIRTFQKTRQLFQRLTVLPHFKPMIGSALAGVLAIVVFLLLNRNVQSLATLGSGYSFLRSTLIDLDSIGVWVLLAVGATKILTSSLTVGSGGAGGVFGPSLVIGGCVGGSVGKLFQFWLPGVVTQPGAFAIVGMAGFFAGAANAPFSTILMVTELTGDYRLLVPTLWVTSLCYILLRPWSLYSKQVNSRLDSPAHKGDFTVDLLEGILVRDVFRESRPGISFREDASLEEIVHALDASSQRYFHVYNTDEELVGIFSVEDVRRYLYDETLWKIVNASDVMMGRVETLQLDDDLNIAMGLFTALNVDELPVVHPENPNQIIGALRRKEAIAAYNKRRLDFQKQKEEENSQQG